MSTSPNEKELLGYFKEIDGANAVKMSSKMALSIDYTQSLCTKLAAKGFLAKVSQTRFPVYCIPENKGKIKERLKKETKPGKAAQKKSMTEVKCAFCKGTGRDPFGLMSVLSKCQVCKGRGTVMIEEPYEKCPVCDGTGVQYNKKLNCLACRGKGVLPMKEGLETCPECGGSGKGAMGLYCLKCKGRGKVYKKTRTKAQSATK